MLWVSALLLFSNGINAILNNFITTFLMHTLLCSSSATFLIISLLETNYRLEFQIHWGYPLQELRACLLEQMDMDLNPGFIIQQLCDFGQFTQILQDISPDLLKNAAINSSLTQKDFCEDKMRSCKLHLSWYLAQSKCSIKSLMLFFLS